MESTCKTTQSTVAVSWFKNEEYYWRSLASGIWLMILTPILLMTYFAFIQFSILSPAVWISDVFTTIFSLKMVSVCIMSQVASLLLTVGHSRALQMCETMFVTKLKFLLHFFHPKQLSNVLFFLMFTLIFTFSLVYLGNPRSKEVDATFLLLYSVVLGIMYSIQLYSCNKNVIQFPIIQQKRFFRFKKLLQPCLKESFILTIQAMKVYYLIYFVGCLFQFIIENLMFELQLKSLSLTSMFLNLCSIKLFWSCFCTSVILAFMLVMSNQLVQMFNTQRFIFPIDASLTENQGKTLCDALQSSDLLLKNLASLDLCCLGKVSGTRRQKIYELTPPGNQPHVWNQISVECMRVLENLRTQLLSVYELKQQSKYRQQFTSPPKTIGEQKLFSPQGNVSNKTTVIGSSNATSLKSEVKNQSASNTTTNKPLQGVTDINVFSNLQMVLWCIEGLSNVVAASITDDRYGVVQRKLPDILSEMLLLLEACELYSKTNVARSSLNTIDTIEATQKDTCNATSLKIAIKTNLYNITTAFGYHISAVRLPTGLKKRLHGFLEFAE